jgi:vacuolar iron transporter family protein
VDWHLSVNLVKSGLSQITQKRILYSHGNFKTVVYKARLGLHESAQSVILCQGASIVFSSIWDRPVKSVNLYTHFVNFFVMNIFQRNIKSIVYGGLDGIITTFAVVSGVIGAQLAVSIILIMGFANLIADGFSMAAGSYLSAKAEGERKHQISHTAIMESLSTFTSFVVFGFLPLLPFIFAYVSPVIAQNVIGLSVLMTFCTLAALGILKARILNISIAKSATEVVIIGGAASLIAYGIGYALSLIV